MGASMMRFAWRLATVAVALVLGISGALAQQIRPAGKIIGHDSEGHSIRQVHANDIDIGYKLVGSGAPLVMIMGLGGTVEHWPPQVIAALSKQYQLILLDNRGMGHTTSNDATFTYKLFADDVIGLLDALGVKKTHVLGYSMGSTVTQELLLTYPQRFDKAIIHATSTDGSNVAAVFKGRTIDNPTVARQIEATTHWKTPMDRIAAVSNQVMFVVGTADTVVYPESSKVLAAAIPGAWLVQFKNATHGLMYETPTGFSRIVLTFLGTDETVKAVAPPPMLPKAGDGKVQQ
ncbi:MAG: alpha/beta hydrolase [Ancalomicrobiaceae bacterium]|nr:alpha/beta hydrolase [Ancalomicrobiaceae bacterium]